MIDVTGKNVVINTSTFSNNTTVKVVDLCHKPFTSNNMSHTFEGCTNLEKVLNINDNVTQMNSTFDSCTALVKPPKLPSNLTEMSSAFRWCSNLKSFPNIPNGVTSLANTFQGCNNVEGDVILPNGLTTLYSTFDRCFKLKKCPKIPENVTNMHQAFLWCRIIEEAPIIPRYVTKLDECFYGCTNLKGNVMVQSKGVNLVSSCFQGTSSLPKYVYIPFNSKETRPLYAWGSGSDTYYTLSSTPSVGDKVLNVDGSETGKTISAIGSGYIEFEDGWVEATLPSSADWNLVCYGGDKFVAIAYNTNKAAYSTDGITWTATTLPITAKWNSIAYGAGKFIVVANETEQHVYSTDGINWTVITREGTYEDGGYIYPAFICYGNGQFFIISNAGYYRSTDGITWIYEPIDFIWLMMMGKGYPDFSSVVAGNDRVIVMCPDDNDVIRYVAYTTSDLDYSLINVYSEIKNIPRIQKAYTSTICYANGMFVSLAGGVDDWGEIINAVYHSNNGENWLQESLPVSATWTSLTYGNGKFVGVSGISDSTHLNSNIGVCSEDGIHWEEMTLPSTADWQSVTYGNGKFVAIAKGSNKVAYCSG